MDAVQFGQYAPHRRLLVHLSDTHLLAGNAPSAASTTRRRVLRAPSRRFERLGTRPDAIVVTGDLTDLGEAEAYQALRGAIDPVAERLGAPVVWVAATTTSDPR